tara:strand:- start:204 stop:578 length:375 start_codon:yes stop_codon:yes gene_type:complete
MTFWVQIFLAFIAGVIINKVWTSFLTVGYTIIMLKDTQKVCLEILKETLKQTESAMEIKYSFMERAEQNEKRVALERKFDEQMVEGLKKHMVRFINSRTPQHISNVDELQSWDDAMKFLEKESS